VGTIEVFAEESKSLTEVQHDLIEAVGERLGRFCERMALDRELRRTEAWYRQLFEQARDGIVLVEAERAVIVDVNRQFLRMLEMEDGEVRGRWLREVLPGLGREALLERLHNWSSDPVYGRVSIPVETKKGDALLLEVSCTELHSSEERMYQLVCRDVTDRQRLVRQLAESEMRYRAIFLSAPVAMVLCDRDGNVLDVNTFLLTKFFDDAVEKADLIGRNFLELNIFDSEEFRERFLWYVDGICVQIHEVPITESSFRATGCANIRICPLMNTEHEVEGGVIIIEDVTEFRETQRAMLQSAKMAAVGQMTSGFAHEIGTPLGIISANAQYLLQEIGEEQGAEELRIILSETNRITNLIKHLLIFSRPAKFARQPVDINALIREVLDLFVHQKIMENVEVQARLSDRLPRLRVEPTLMRQVFLNLLINACQAMPDGGPLRIATSIERSQSIVGKRAPCVRICFEDEGTGIAHHDLRQIFTPFFTTKDTGKGTGLGLSVSYRIVQNHGGDITAESDGPGRGARFTVYLPLVLAEHTKNEDRMDPPHGAEGVEGGFEHGEGSR
jgi:PAS domain S-box-containing protein